MSTTSDSHVAEAVEEMFRRIYGFLDMIIRRFCTNLYNSFAEVTAYRWTKVGLSVIGYILIRPYIEAFFKKMHERDRKKHMEKERAKAAERGKKAKVSPNALRGGGAGEGEGKVLGEVENTDDEVEGQDAEEFATASGVPEWGKNTRKRMKKHQKKLEKEAVENKGSKLTEEQLMDLLDWSESEGEKNA